VDALSADRSRYVRTMAVAGSLATAVWLWLQLDLLDGRVFGNFYDIQARALLDGHLAVPDGSLGNEAFVARGHEYLYNPPGPSFLRMPLFLVTNRFDGRLTTLSMLAAWVVTVVLVALLVWRVRGLLRPGAPLGQPEAVALGAFLVVATAGSTLLYLGSIPWVFHEAYAWAIPMTIGSAHALLGVLRRPTTAGVLATAGFTLGALLSRATAGFACAAAVLLAAAWLARGGQGRSAKTWWWKVGVAGAVPVAISAGLNWAKFRHPWLFPIEDQVFTGLSQSRRDAIEANGGDLFGFDLVWSTIPAYLRPDGIRFTSLFPFVSLPAEPAAAYRGASFDLTYRTGSVTAFMPLLLGLAVTGVVAVSRRGAEAGAVLLRLPMLGVALIPGGVLFGAYISHRYTSEFVPFLVVAGAVGAIHVARALEGLRPQARRWSAAGLGALAVYGVLTNLAIAVTNQALANPGTVLADHVRRQEELSGLLGGDLDDHVVASVQLPGDAPVDEVHIIGECQAQYVSTGEEHTPWSEAGARALVLRFTRSSEPSRTEGALPLAQWVGHRTTELVLEREGTQVRLALRGGGREVEGEWAEPALGDTFDVEVATDRTDEYVATLEGADGDLRVPKEDRDVDWYWQPNVLGPLPSTPQALAAEGVLVEARGTEAPPGCEDRLQRHREQVAAGTP